MDNENINSSISFPPLWHQIKFTMAINIFSIFPHGVDYRIDLSGEKVNSTYTKWKQILYETSVDGSNNNISTKSFDKFPFLNKDFVNFSVDLRSLGNPQKYQLLFYLTDEYIKDGKLCRMVDTTNWLPAPPPEYNIVVSPSSIFMRPGESKDIPITITGNIQIQSNTTLNIDKIDKKHSNVNVNLISNETVISSFANGSSLLHIDIPDVQNNYYFDEIKNFMNSLLHISKPDIQINKSNLIFIPITSKIFLPTTIINKTGETFYNNDSNTIQKQSVFVLTILPPLILLEKIEKLSDAIKPIGDLWQIFVAIGTVIITIIVYFDRKKSSRGTKGKGKWKIDEY
jgi:hypothetical protein